MIRALYTAAMGMNAQTTNIDVIADQQSLILSGFKKGRADFQRLAYVRSTWLSQGLRPQAPRQILVVSKSALVCARPQFRKSLRRAT